MKKSLLRLLPICLRNVGRGLPTNSRLFSNAAEDDVTATAANTNAPKLDNLIDMDVVIYSLNDSPKTLFFGAMQEDGILSPLSAWSTEPAFGNSIEFLVDEADRFALVDAMKNENENESIILHHLLSEAEMSYGSRQCHRGVGNPHGEESELLYYVEQNVIDKFDVEVVVKPDLEILW
ncbi:MAG: hypothetical protein SGARI_004628 [Bacillariaceae sp.]